MINIDVNNSHVAYSVHLLQDFKTFPERSVFVSSIKMNEYFIPALFIHCSSKDISYFRIKIPPPEPGFKFRYYDFGVNIPVAVVEVYLDFNKRKTMNLFLDPGNRFVQHFFKAAIRTEWLSFNYYQKNSNLVISSSVKLGLEDLDWFKRNSIKSQRLLSSYDVYQTALQKVLQIEKEQKIHYDFWDVKDKRYFAEYAEELIMIAK